LGVLRLMESAPAEVVLLGVQPQSTDWGTVLTPALEAARKDLVEAALRQIESWATRMIAARLPIRSN
jgi:hydrogenase maturation protease